MPAPIGPETPSRLVAAYGADPAVPDEMVDREGRLRPVWRGLVDYLDSLTPEEVSRRFARGDQYLRDAGVFYRHYGKGEVAVRDWPLSHIPVLIAENEWRDLAEGLVQRAELLEAIVADLHGPNQLVANGDLPGFLVASNPHWLRPMVGARPAGGHFLWFIAMEVGRGPDGRWWVLGDRTEAPSGAGFALESRVATTRVFADIYQASNVHRLAGFFGAFKKTLGSLGRGGSVRPGILTPGPYNETYYEQAYIARYLGLALLEGEDLVVEKGRLMVRTIEGPRPIDVLWRRVEAAWCDPLELDERSRLGVPGLSAAVRSGGVTMINALGAGILETQALLAFLPALCLKLRGEPLRIPNIATWWCGQPAEREHVRANAASMVIGPAFSNRPTIEQAGDPADAAAIATLMASKPRELVGQERVTLSTSPAWIDGKLVPRPVNIRLFLARSEEGWHVMPGGFARVGAGDDPAAVAMGRGGSVADVWIVGERPVAPVTLLPAGAGPFVRPRPTAMPSRAADNLFWLGRYAERAEGTLRVLRGHHGRLAESGDPNAPVVEATRAFLARHGIDAAEPLPPGILAIIESAVASAGNVRDRFSMDGWSALADLSSSARQLSTSVTPGDDAARAHGVLIRKLTGFSGLVHENMYRQTGWRFLSIGRALERAIGMAELVAAAIDEDAPEGLLDLAVEVGDSVMIHRRRYAVTSSRDSVVDLLVLDPMNPRAVVHEIERVREHAAVLPGFEENGQLSPLARALLSIHARLRTAEPADVDSGWLTGLSGEIAGVSDLLTRAYL